MKFWLQYFMSAIKHPNEKTIFTLRLDKCFKDVFSFFICILTEFLKRFSNFRLESVVISESQRIVSVSCFHPIVFIISWYWKITLIIVPFNLVTKRQAKDTESQRSLPKFLQSTALLKKSCHCYFQAIVSSKRKRTRPKCRWWYMTNIWINQK